ncbi:MAG TPA: helix-turn-helix transcriptional regulator [Steroidobacteraceae bacterium]|nr:helix-turn-helix transcriptional regulator [Steroidobacteraceae bacterium]
MAGSDRALMAGVPELLLLQLLARRTMYGYELAQQVRLASRDTLAFGESVLYPALHSLEQRRLLQTRERTVDGRVRIYYELTAKGSTRLTQLTAEWRRIATGVEAVLAAGPHG